MWLDEGEIASPIDGRLVETVYKALHEATRAGGLAGALMRGISPIQEHWVELYISINAEPDAAMEEYGVDTWEEALEYKFTGFAFATSLVLKELAHVDLQVYALAISKRLGVGRGMHFYSDGRTFLPEPLPAIVVTLAAEGVELPNNQCIEFDTEEK